MDNLGFIYESLDLKILILFILRRLPGEIEQDRLQELCQLDGAVSYFDFAVCLDDLQENGQLTREDGYCCITDRGRSNAETVESSLPYSVRLHTEAACAEEAERILRSRNITARHSVQHGICMMELGLNDGVSDILHMELLCADETQARKLEKNFRRHAEDIYQEIMTLLNR
ncbi:MAG: DUF4364 family protein [Oscillospiraceae bacterium]|nr:DUF4364 family protein [Oscillospiraceae bacterium]